MSIFGNVLSGKKTGGVFPALDLSESEPASDSDSDLLIKEKDVSSTPLRHNFVSDDRDGRHFRRRITCTNPGCDKKQVPSAVRQYSKVCKGTAPANHVTDESATVVTLPSQQSVLA